MGCGGSSNEGAPTETVNPKKHQSQDKDKNAAKEENKTYQQKLAFLSQVQLFKRIPRDMHPQLAAACIPADFKAKQVVIKQGDPGSEFFVVKSGEAGVFVSKEGGASSKVATLKVGDYFGEFALLRNEPRTATICAETELKTFKITREKFQELGLHTNLQFANRKAVGGGLARKIETKPPSPKSEKEKALIAKALKASKNLQTMVQLDDQRVQDMIDVAWKEKVVAGKEIITEGDLIADYFYVVQEGSFDVYVSGEPGESNEDNSGPEGNGPTLNLLTTMGVSDCFGELALLYVVPRAATVKAKEDGILWVIDRQNFKRILMTVSEQKINDYVKYLGRVQILESLLSDEKRAVAQALVEMHFGQNEEILLQGQPGNTFYILYDGEVTVTKDGVELNRLTASAAAGTAQFFGERALLNNEPRAATVAVTSATAKALALDRDSFNLLLGPLDEIIKRTQAAKDQPRQSMLDADGKKRGGAKPFPAAQQGSDRKRVQKADLQRVGLLGCGGFGSVELFVHKDSGESYAMKCLSKGFIVKTGMQESVMNEKNILMMTNSEFIVKLYETFNGHQYLYFLLEPALGGELYATYNRKGLHGSERHAKYYVAGVVFAFEHLHERRIIYRDLKPENLLLTDKGRLKLTDMGLAKFVIGKTYTTCGTPDYFAPELIMSAGHTNAVDWWMLGILTFELMSGHPPFESTYPMQTYSKVVKGINKVPFPMQCQGVVGDLIKALLKKEPSERLPMRPGGTKNLKEHKWYQGFDWVAMQNLTLEPPHKPTVKSKKDTQNFTAKKEEMPRHIEYHDDGSGWDKDFATQ